MSARTALCLECRTALTPGEACDAHPRAAVVDLAVPAQRDRAVATVWGPPHLRTRNAAGAGAAGGTAGGLFEGCGGCDGCDVGSLDLGGEAAIALLVVIAAAIVAILLYFLIKRIVYAVRQYRARPKPQGSRWHPSVPPRVLRGTITNVTQTKAPLSGTPCAAWSIVVGVDRSVHGPIMLRDGATGGFTLALEDGRTITIPAGRIRIDGDGEKEDIGAEYLRQVDPAYDARDATPVIPADRAREVRVMSGDTVTVIGGLVERFDPNAPAGYREAPPTRLVLERVATLRVA